MARKALAPVLLFALLPLGGLWGAELPAPPEIRSRAAVVLDATTGTVLYEKGADLPIPPASLTKLVTMHVALEEVAAGRASLDDIVALPRPTWAVSQGWGSSLMFLAPGQRVTLRELLLGLAVSSGNDAAIAVALHLAPSVEAFAQRMNAAVHRLGLTATSFVEPSGYSELNMTTAREFALFCAFYLKRHPGVLQDYHSVREFSYPKPENLPESFRDKPGTVVQYNRNLLLDVLEGVDGLKTGFIVESGYNIALTAQRNQTRLIAVLLGGPGSGSAQGGRFRAEDGGGLLNWAFGRFRTIRPELRRLDPVRVWKGDAPTIGLVPAGDLNFTVDLDRGHEVSTRVERETYVTAPVDAGSILGTLVFSDSRGELHRVPLAAEGPVGRGSFFIRAVDAVRLFFLRLRDRLFA